jgi:hypothetical protein
MFRWLQLRRIGGQKVQVDMVRHAQALGAVPARPIQQQDDLLGRTCFHGMGKPGKFRLKQRDADRGRQMQDGAPRGGMDEPDEIAPLTLMACEPTKLTDV